MQNLVPASEAIRLIAQTKGTFVAWIGAGVSLEAGIKAGSEICNEIKALLASAANAADPDAWARENLDWDDPSRRYSKCVSRLGNSAVRIQYFRRLIRSAEPSFSHHAIAMLMERGYFRRTCLTTNFDKLIEMSFAQQSVSEYQAIRAEDEFDYWASDDKNYIIKLHGDYDTANILNTLDETIRIPEQLQEIGRQLLRRSGLLVLGSSGYEQSVISFFEELWRQRDKSILNFGTYWGVYMGNSRPPQMTSNEEMTLLQKRITEGTVSRGIVECAERAARASRDFNFFPVWGSGQFLYDLVGRLGDRGLSGNARRFLDHQMRLRDVLGQGGLDEAAINVRLARLAERERQVRETGIAEAPAATHVLHAQLSQTSYQVDLVYGDLTSRSLMAHSNFGQGYRAVVSPDDIYLSAGGGAALALLEKAGKALVLSETLKFGAISHRNVVVTSGFRLPVNYIFHAATVALREDGSSDTTEEDVQVTMSNVLQTVRTLGVKILLVPLLGAGTEGMAAGKSLQSILRAFSDDIESMPASTLRVVVVVRQESELFRNDARSILQASLPAFTISDRPTE